MKACFVQHGQDAPIDRLRRHGVTELYVPAENSPLANAGELQRLADAGFHVGLFYAWHWGPFATADGAEFARRVSAHMARIGWTPRQPVIPGQWGGAWVMLDIENYPPLNSSIFAAFVRDCVREWRRLRPTRRTCLTFESFQGGLFNGKGDAVEAVKAANMDVLVQFYANLHGDPLWPTAPDEAVDELVLYGFDRGRARGFYDARKPPLGWDGALWTSGDLPG